jgi:hypothetical protein
MTPITLEQLHELYDGVVQRSLRMETRQAYAVPWEDERTAAWLRGGPEPRSPSLESHRDDCRAIVDSGRHIMRVRFVELPMTEYTKREFVWAYPGNAAAGEDILVVDRAEHPEFDHVREDFVVFDDTALMYYRYTDDDRLTGYDYSDDPAVVAAHVTLAEEVLAAAIPFAEWPPVQR